MKILVTGATGTVGGHVARQARHMIILSTRGVQRTPGFDGTVLYRETGLGRVVRSQAWDAFDG